MLNRGLKIVKIVVVKTKAKLVVSFTEKTTFRIKNYL